MKKSHVTNALRFIIRVVILAGKSPIVANTGTAPHKIITARIIKTSEYFFMFLITPYKI